MRPTDWAKQVGLQFSFNHKGLKHNNMAKMKFHTFDSFFTSHRYTPPKNMNKLSPIDIGSFFIDDNV